MSNQETKLVKALENLITAALIIDGQYSPPETADVEHLHKMIAEARSVIRAYHHRPGGYMAATPRFKIFNPQGEYVAACEYAEEAACLVAMLGDGAEIRTGHSKKDCVWREGSEGQSAEQSYDFVAEAIHERTGFYEQPCCPSA